MGTLDRRTAIVTGAGRGIGRGIGWGIGRGIALRLAKEGAHVVVASRSATTVDGTVAEIRTLGLCALGIVVDVGDEAH